MRALLLVLFVVACAPRDEIRWHALSGYDPHPTTGQVDVFVETAPASSYRVVGLILVSPKYPLRDAARMAASTARSLGCDLVTAKRDGHEVAGRARRVLIASIGSWGSFGGSEECGSGGWRCTSSGYDDGGETPIDPRMHELWCGVYVTDAGHPRSAG